MAADPIARPAAAGTVELADANRRVGACAEDGYGNDAPMEIKERFHSRLEISQRTRDFHIPTAASRISIKKNKDNRHGPRIRPMSHLSRRG
jgi:hypothetical protein